MSAATGLHIDTFDVDYSDLISGNNTTLIEIETMLCFCFFLSLEIFSDGVGLKNNTIGFIFDLHFHLFAD